MTIINKLAELQRDLEKGTHNLTSNYLTDKDVGDIMNDLSELQWWRGQNLIPRERALKCLYSCEHELFCTETDWLKKCLEEIPKAEPTSSKMEQVQKENK